MDGIRREGGGYWRIEDTWVRRRASLLVLFK